MAATEGASSPQTLVLEDGYDLQHNSLLCKVSQMWSADCQAIQCWPEPLSRVCCAAIEAPHLTQNLRRWLVWHWVLPCHAVLASVLAVRLCSCWDPTEPCVLHWQAVAVLTVLTNAVLD